MNIQMLDLRGQYRNIKEEVDRAVASVIEEAHFINGSEVDKFASELGLYLDSKHVIPCANGTDALQIALMSLELKPGDEVILPAFTYAATAEVVALLGLVPVLADVSARNFNINPGEIVKVVTEKTRAIMPVHLFGQSASMEPLLEISSKYGLKVIEDNAQAIGAEYCFSGGETKFCGTIGDIGCTSFFPSKNLGCYGDGGAIFSSNPYLGERLRMIANHGQKEKYRHDIVGCNSRLDTIQAAILRIKLANLDKYTAARQQAASVYRELLADIEEITLPYEESYSTHVYHQFTIRCSDRDGLKNHLASKGVPSMVYYPHPIEAQPAFRDIVVKRSSTEVAVKLAKEVLSLPMHTELKYEEQKFIAETIKEFISEKR